MKWSIILAGSQISLVKIPQAYFEQSEMQLIFNSGVNKKINNFASTKKDTIQKTCTYFRN